MTNHQKVVFIYTYGRIGSTSLFNSIKPYAETHHFHNIQPYFNEYLKKNNYSSLDNFLSTQHIVYVATGVREPISRTISAFFTWLTKEAKPNNLTQYYGGGNYYLHSDPNYLKTLDVNIFIDKLLQILTVDNIFDSNNCWFNNNIRKFFNIDIYNYPFDPKKGYTIINQNQYKILVYRQENLNENHAMINDWLGTNQVRLHKENESTTKWYYELYHEVKKNIHIPKIILDQIFQNKKIRHFYSDTEISNFYQKYMSS